MSHKDNLDLRQRGAGGWCYAEHELFSVFAPLIGPYGVAVYMAMCRLIPLAAIDVDKPVTHRRVEEHSCCSKGTVNRKIAEIVKLGMIEERRWASRRNATYTLVPLRELALVGIDELRKRLGAPQGGTASEEDGEIDEGEGAGEDVERRSGSHDASHAGQTPHTGMRSAPAGSDRSGAPQGGTEGNGLDLQAEGEDDANPVPQKEASVPQKQGTVPQKTASVPQNRAPYMEGKEVEEKLKAPPTPSGGASPDPGDQALWNHMKTLLKSELYSIPGNLAAAKKFQEIKPGENDYDAAFRDWWLIEAKGIPGGLLLATGATDIPSTHAGIMKYQESRLAPKVRKFWKLPAGAKVLFSIQKGQTR